jgi:hypothetical protein
MIYRPAPDAIIYLGRVSAPDEQTAIKVAIERLMVTNVYQQRALIARKAP